MTLRFSDRGPEFPAPLIDALLAGEVVFLCGTGVSAPQLPDFKSLVDRTFENLVVEQTPSEQRAYEAGRFEEVLGSLSRRLADPQTMVRSASALLAVPEAPRLDQHRTLLRLSRDLANKVLIITTNFDTFFERGLVDGDHPPLPDRLSYAGQALPAPGSADFNGIIHIHGRLADAELGLEATPLVLTSADYGDAYMRSGWASRFLFDLARCKTIVLVGYSANDAPVRYFLNVLEADRARFPDLRPVYALDAYADDPAEAEASWGTIAVTPLPYCRLNAESGAADHSSLWRDLALLADLVERPKQSRRDRAQALLARPAEPLADEALRELRWLFTERRDLWSTLLATVTDPGWFAIFQEHGLWTSEDAVWMISAWTAKDFADRGRLELAAEWQNRLGRPFIDDLDRRSRQAKDVPAFWARAWRLFSLARPDRHGWSEDNGYQVKQRLESGLILDSDLRRAVALMSPTLSLRGHYRGFGMDDPDREPRRLGDLISTELTIGDDYAVKEVIDALEALPEHAPRIVDLVTDQLRAAIALSVDLGMIEDDYDTSDFSVPSIEEHQQNEHHDGIIFLIRAVVNAFPKLVAADRDHARAAARLWRGLPGRAGVRLFLHVLRNKQAFEADEAVQALLDLSDADFWIIRREIAMLIAERAGDAGAGLVDALETRILTTGEAYYSRYEIAADQVDWRAHARDAEVWLRLTMLDQAGKLGDAGAAELAAIKARRDYLDRPVEDRDYFGSYVGGVREIVGDPQPLVEAEPDDRLQVAQALRHSRDLDAQAGWSAYCRAHPEGALETLAAAELNEANLGLWRDLIGALSFREDGEDARRDALVVRVFAILADHEPATLCTLASPLVDLLRFGPRRLVADLEGWLDRLWRAVLLEEREPDFAKDVYAEAINAPAGRLCQTMLIDVDAARKAGEAPAQQLIQQLRVAAAGDGAAGAMARAILVHDLAFIVAIDRNEMGANLAARLGHDDPEARALRQVLVTYASVTPELSHFVPDAILRGVVETSASDHAASTIASKILRPALGALRGEQAGRWGLDIAAVAAALRTAPSTVRRGTLDVRVRWHHADEAGVEEAWKNSTGPFFERVWPKERRFVEDTNTRDLIALVVGAGKSLPDALNLLRPFIAPFSTSRGSLHAITNSKAPENFPDEILDLLWLAFGPASRASAYEMPKVLDRLIEAKPALERDRRLQWLEQRSVRYD